MKRVGLFTCSLWVLLIASGIAQDESGRELRYYSQSGLPVSAIDSPAVPLFARLIESGFSAEIALELGDLFFAEERPFQARFFFQQALELGGANAAKDQLNQAESRIQDLADRYRSYEAQARDAKAPTHYCSMAAIRFHQGFTGEALGLLQEGREKLGEDVQLAGMYNMYVFTIRQEYEKRSLFRQETDRLLFEGDYRGALMMVGRLYYHGLGSQQAYTALKDLQAMYPDKVDRDAVERLVRLQSLLENKN